MSRKKTKLQSVTEPPQIRTDAAGIDISPEVIYVAVDPRKDATPIRHYGTVTAEWYRIANWLKACGVRTVAMESTGVYWIPLYQVLDERGFEVYLVNARHYKNVPGRRRMSAIRPGCNTCTPWGCCKDRSGRHRRSARYAPFCGTGPVWWRRRASTSSTCRRRWIR